MARELEYLEEALEEAEAAARWYAERSTVAAAGFSEEIDAAESAIQKLPEAWPRFDQEPGHWTEGDLRSVEERLAETPCHAGRSFDRVIFPERTVAEVLNAKWLANRPLQSTSGSVKVM